MNLDHVTLEIRPRSAWEAVDLGLLMARRWWLPLMKAWLITSFPVLLIALLIPAEKWWASALIIWWLKPLYERPLLHILSRAVFNDLPSTRATLKQFPSLALKQLFLSLTWRRPSPTRSMDLPVLQLEGLAGARRRERLDILHREDSAPASLLGVLGSLLEFFLWIGLMILVWAFIPRELNIEWAGLFFSSESAELTRLQVILWYCALALSAPFYVACGFALYLNRRIKLEAWDIDIAFRRIVSKRHNSGTLTSLLGTLALGFCALLLDAPPMAYADEQLPAIEEQNAEYASEAVIDRPLGEYRELNRDSAQEAIKHVMQQPEFSRKETRRQIKWEKDEDEPDWEFWKKLLDSLSDFKGFVAAASLLEVMLWLAVFALVVFVIYRYRHWLAAQFVRVKTQPRPREKPVTMFGMDVTRESLPENISQSALGLLHTGDVRAALALLYRASLFQLIQYGVDVHDGNTESECVNLMRDHLETVTRSNKNTFSAAQVDYFSQLTRVWQQLAYGHMNPEEETATQLCNRWNTCWQFATPVPGSVK
jgi:hypothetical protein